MTMGRQDSPGDDEELRARLDAYAASRLDGDPAATARARAALMAEARRVLGTPPSVDDGAIRGRFGRIFYTEAEYHHPGLEVLYFDDKGNRTWRYGFPPMHYPTHCTAYLTGVTGERRELPGDLADQILALRLVTTLPVCVGFGISRPEQVAAVGRLADGVIVGSAIVRFVEERAGSSALMREVGEFIARLKEPLRAR